MAATIAAASYKYVYHADKTSTLSILSMQLFFFLYAVFIYPYWKISHRLPERLTDSAASIMGAQLCRLAIQSYILPTKLSLVAYTVGIMRVQYRPLGLHCLLRDKKVWDLHDLTSPQPISLHRPKKLESFTTNQKCLIIPLYNELSFTKIIILFAI